MELIKELIYLSEMKNKVKLKDLIDEDEKLQQLFDANKLNPNKPNAKVNTGLEAGQYSDVLEIWYYKGRTYVQASGEAYNALPYSCAGKVSAADIKAEYVATVQEHDEDI